jgi:DNA-binding transcriptional LysR family regulator
MDLEELRAFLHVVESGSFLAAADTLQVSRTTLRRRVGSLEALSDLPKIKMVLDRIRALLGEL